MAKLPPDVKQRIGVPFKATDGSMRVILDENLYARHKDTVLKARWIYREADLYGAFWPIVKEGHPSTAHTIESTLSSITAHPESVCIVTLAEYIEETCNELGEVCP